MKAFIPFVVFLLAATMAAAEFTQDITLNAPRQGDTVLATDRFSFTVGSGETVDTCSLIVDGAIAKSARYDSNLKGKTLSFAMVPDEGDHTWTVTCSTTDGDITAPAESFTLAVPESPVTVKASGTVRGSMVHIFKMENNADQPPVVVPKVATGDFIEVSLLVPPSTLKKEFYVRSRLTQNGTPVAWITWKQEDYYIKQGENTTLNLTQSARVIATLDSIVNNRMVFVFYSAAAPRESVEVPEDNSITPGADAPETPDAAPETPVNDTASDDDAGTTDDAPKQGAFKRFLSWLSGIFG